MPRLLILLPIYLGAKNATVPIYSAEMAPHRIRGALVMFWQLWVVAGKLLLFCQPPMRVLIVVQRHLSGLLR